MIWPLETISTIGKKKSPFKVALINSIVISEYVVTKLMTNLTPDKYVKYMYKYNTTLV